MNDPLAKFSNEINVFKTNTHFCFHSLSNSSQMRMKSNRKILAPFAFFHLSKIFPQGENDRPKREWGDNPRKDGL